MRGLTVRLLICNSRLCWIKHGSRICLRCNRCRLSVRSLLILRRHLVWSRQVGRWRASGHTLACKVVLRRLWLTELRGQCLGGCGRTLLSEGGHRSIRRLLMLLHLSLSLCLRVGLRLRLLHVIHDIRSVLLILLRLLPWLLRLIFLAILHSMRRHRGSCRILHALREVVQLLRIATSSCMARR